MNKTWVAGGVLWRAETEMEWRVQELFARESPLEGEGRQTRWRPDGMSAGPTGSSRADRCWRSAYKGLDLRCWLRATSWTVWPLVPLPGSVINWRLLRGEHECHLNAKGNPKEANSWNLSGNQLPPPGQQVLSWRGAEHHISRSAMVYRLCHTDLVFHDTWKQLLMALMGLASWRETWIEGG